MKKKRLVGRVTQLRGHSNKKMDHKPDINRVTFDSADFTRWVEGVASNTPESFRGITQDTRELKTGMLYAALRGENFDGHDFVGKAFEVGAAAALVNESWKVPDALSDSALIRVVDTRRALLDAARAWRELSSARIIGVTGSSGKTTTKEITAALLAAGGKVCRTKGNMNNDVGLPLCLLSMPADCDFGVFELGANHPGEISLLAEILQPDCGVITSVGSAHIENFASIEAIAREKGALLSSIAPGGRVVVSMDTTEYHLLKKMSTVPAFTVSMQNTEADYYGEVLDALRGRVCVIEGGTRCRTVLESGLPGAYNASNLLLAFAVARMAGISSELAVEALRSFSLPGMRWRRIEMDNGGVVINDAYNANPESVKAVLENFQMMECGGDKIAVLGDMLELGQFAAELHRDVGAAVARMNPESLFLVGALASRYIAEGAARHGYSQAKVFCFNDVKAAGEALKKRFAKDDVVLLKASRGMRLEGVLDGL